MRPRPLKTAAEPKEKFKIEFNKVSDGWQELKKNSKNMFFVCVAQDLTVKHKVTKRNGNEIADTKTFEQFSCYLNFSNDMIEFSFKVNQQKWKQIKIESQAILYEVIKTTNYRKQMKELPLVTNNASSEDSYFTIVSLASTVKNTLLGLFSPHKKEFQLKIEWSADKMKYETVFFALIPSIEQKWVKELLII